MTGIRAGRGYYRLRQSCIKQLRLGLLIVLAPLVLAACTPSPFHIIVNADLRTSTMLDLIVVVDNSVLADQILTAGSEGWFTQKQMLQATHTRTLQVAHFQLPPLTTLKANWPEITGRNKRFLIAAHALEVQQILEVEDGTLSLLSLDRNGMTITL